MGNYFFRISCVHARVHAKKSRAKNLSRDSYEVIISLCFVVHVGPGGT